jgi:hypothetical protein
MGRLATVSPFWHAGNEDRDGILAVGFALAAAFCSEVNLLTRRAASISAPNREKGWRLALYLVRQPLWLLGWAARRGHIRLPGSGPA